MIKLLSLFSGIGAFEKALDRLEVPYELVNYCEIDKYASKSYSMIHECDESLNLGDITKIDTSKLSNDIDLITYGFPCQDISVAGNLKGFEHEGKRTRSGLFFEALRIIEDAQPKFTIAENVKNLTGKRFKKEFEIVLTSLEQAGYNNYWQVLNAKDYGIPQNRERVFIVSIRKDIDNGMFKFPKPLELKLRLKDMLEDEVDERYYLSENHMKTYMRDFGSKGKLQKNDGICDTLQAAMGGGGGNTPIIKVKEATKKGYAEAGAGDSINLEQPNSKTRRGRVGKQVAQTLTTSCNQAIVEPMICASRGRNPNNPSSRVAGEPTEQRIEVNTKGLANTLTTVQKDNLVLEPKTNVVYDDYNSRIRNDQNSIGTITENIGKSALRNGYKLIENNLRIRKLTPLECWRLMGFDDEDFYKVKGVSNTQLYKQAGNSIVVDVLVYLFKELKECFPDHFGEVVWEDDL